MAKILLAEDELLIGWDIKESLEADGHEVDGPHASIAEARRAAEAALPDLGFLDVRLTDGEIDPLAAWLAERGVKLVFHSGHIAACDYEERYPGAEFCSKPSTPRSLTQAVARQLSGTPPERRAAAE